MYYDSIENKHGLKYDPFKALIAPRPIGWISSVSADGICNLAPYSFFNAVSDRPPYVMFSSADIKDSIRNIEQTGEFRGSRRRRSRTGDQVRVKCIEKFVGGELLQVVLVQPKQLVGIGLCTGAPDGVQPEPANDVLA